MTPTYSQKPQKWYKLCCLDILNLIFHQQLSEDYQKIYQKCGALNKHLVRKRWQNSAVEGHLNFTGFCLMKKYGAVFSFVCLFFFFSVTAKLSIKYWLLVSSASSWYVTGICSWTCKGIYTRIIKTALRAPTRHQLKNALLLCCMLNVNYRMYAGALSPLI